MKTFKADILSDSPLSQLLQKAKAWNISFETLYCGQLIYQLSW